MSRSENERHKAISRAAYILWERSGKPDGHDLDIWLTAEAMMPNPLPWGWSAIIPDGITHKESKRAECQCDLCQYSRKVDDAINSRDPERLIEVVTELMQSTYCVGMDYEVLQAVMDGSWPGAVEQLTDALEKAKNHPNRRYDRNLDCID